MSKGMTEKNTQGKRIKGITCDVRNCSYNDEEGCCNAGKINVGPGYAASCTDTVCATFRIKE